MKRVLGMVLIFLASVLVYPFNMVDGAVRYEVIEIGENISVRALNNNGEVVGKSDLGHFLWSETSGMTLLPISDDYVITDLNDNGQFSGYRRSSAVLWTDINTPVNLGSNLYNNPDANSSYSVLYAINNNGAAVGYDSYSWYDERPCPVGMVCTMMIVSYSYANPLIAYGQNNFHYLGTLGGTRAVANDINDKGQVVGYSMTMPDSNFINNHFAFLWSGSTMKNLGSLLGHSSTVRAINESSWVVGVSDNLAFIWDSANGMRPIVNPGPRSDAFDINDMGDVIGSYTDGSTGGMYLWNEARGARDMNDLIEPGAGWTVSSLYDINNAGVILGSARNTDGLLRKVLFKPLPCTDNDNDYFAIEGGRCGPVDCNDNSADANPSGTEVCDGLDNDCNGLTDEVPGADNDGDGYTIFGSCEGTGDDCDDADADVFTGNAEICDDAIDNDCDGLIDNNDSDCSTSAIRSYEIQQIQDSALGNITPTSLNDDGLVSGYYKTGAIAHAVVWDQGSGPQSLNYSNALSVNNRRQVIGTKTSGWPYYKTSLQVYDLLSQTTSDIALLDSDTSGGAWDISEAGQVAGYSGLSYSKEAFVWDKINGTKSLGFLPGGTLSEAFAVNADGNTAGYSSSASGTQAFLWNTTNGMQALARLSGDYLSKAFDINDTNDIVGYSQGAAGERAFIWNSAEGMKEITPLSKYYKSRALAINSAREVAGYTSSVNGEKEAFLWTETAGVLNLESLLVPNALLHDIDLDSAEDINSKGQIIALDGNSGYLLTPAGLQCTANAECPAGYSCKTPDGQCGGQGTCKVNPAYACSSASNPVCGCDGITYTNPCEAAAAGVSVDTTGACTGNNDHDSDGTPDDTDNCPDTENSDQADTDNDGIGDACDNCVEIPNPDQRDTNADEDDNTAEAGIQHYGNICDGDFDNNGIVEIRDFILWRPFAGQQTDTLNEDMDLNGDGAVWTDDFIIWRGLYGKRPGPGVTE